IQRVLGVDEGGDAAGALNAGDGVQRERGLAARLRSVNFDDAPLRVTSDPEGDVEPDGARWNGADVLDRLTVLEPHDRALAVLFLDAAEGELDRLLTVLL